MSCKYCKCEGIMYIGKYLDGLSPQKPNYCPNCGEYIGTEPLEPLSIEELHNLDKVPIFLYYTDKKLGLWEIVSLDDDGNLYFINNYLIYGNDSHILNGIKNGKIIPYKTKPKGVKMA